MKKCTKCGAPLDGFLAKIAAIAGVKQSLTNPDVCNKCEGSVVSTVATQQSSEPVQPATAEAPASTAAAGEPKDNIQL